MARHGKRFGASKSNCYTFLRILNMIADLECEDIDAVAAGALPLAAAVWAAAKGGFWAGVSAGGVAGTLYMLYRDLVDEK
jgi:hypothetical protein